MDTILDHRLPEIVLQPDATLPEAALAYVHAGFPVLPLRGKLPLVPHGLDDASVDQAQIKRWWRRWPLANIGIPTGSPSGLIVLDIDSRHSGLDSFAHLQRALQHRAADLHCPPVFLLATRLQRTGSAGLHVMFGWRDELDLGNAVGFAGYPGLDVRGKRGYIVVAPSRHVCGGVYSWLNPGPLQPFPDLLVDLLHARARALSTPRFPHVPQPTHRHVASRRRDPEFILNRVLEQASIGNRHHKALSLSFQLLKDAELSPTQAEEWIRDYAQRVPQGDGEERYSEEDALACLRWVARHVY